MLFLNTIKNSSGEVLTGKLWRQESSLFSNLPFHSNIMGMDEITRPLQEALSISMSKEWHNKLLVVSKVLMTSILDKSFPQKIGTGLDQVHPFSDTNAVAIVLCDAEKILSAHSKFVGKNNREVQSWAPSPSHLAFDGLYNIFKVRFVTVHRDKILLTNLYFPFKRCHHPLYTLTF